MAHAAGQFPGWTGAQPGIPGDQAPAPEEVPHLQAEAGKPLLSILSSLVPAHLSDSTLQAKKNGGDLSENDNQNLERMTGELSRLQKQLEGQRKQQKSHQQAIQDYRAKQQVCTEISMFPVYPTYGHLIHMLSFIAGEIWA